MNRILIFLIEILILFCAALIAVSFHPPIWVSIAIVFSLLSFLWLRAMMVNRNG